MKKIAGSRNYAKIAQEQTQYITRKEHDEAIEGIMTWVGNELRELRKRISKEIKEDNWDPGEELA